MRAIMNFIFNNIFLIIFILVGYYVYTQYKDLKEKNETIENIFERTLNKYIDKAISDIKNKAQFLKEKYIQFGEEEDEEKEEKKGEKSLEENIADQKKHVVENDLNRLLMIVEKSKTINEKVAACNAINKYHINNKIDFEEYPDMKELDEIGVFTDDVMNSLENGIAIARREYNANAFRYNEKANTFPIVHMTKLLRLPAKYDIFDAPKSSNYEENFEVFEEVEPEINSLASLNLTSEEIEREEAEKLEAEANKEKEEVVIEHSDNILKPSAKIEDKED